MFYQKKNLWLCLWKWQGKGGLWWK